MLHTCVIVVKCSNAPSRAYICISFCNELYLCTSCRSPVSLVLPSYDVPLYLFIKNNTIPVNKHNNAINKIPSNGNLKIYLHDSVKHWWKFENSNPWYIFANNGISKCHILPLLPLYLCIIIIHFFIHNIYQLDLAKSIVTKYGYIIETDRDKMRTFITDTIIPFSNMIILADKIYKGLYINPTQINKEV